MLSCRKTTQLISESFERKLSLREKLAVRMHLLVCRFCPLFRSQILFIENAMRQMRSSEKETEILEGLDRPALSPEAMERIRNSIRERLQH
jgi:hypothetical protein